MRITAISDTHSFHEQLAIPEADVLVHCGDFGLHGSLEELELLNDFFLRLPHRHKLLVGGNHDFCLQRQQVEATAILTAAAYLQDSSIAIDGVVFYGSPWQPVFCDMAFNLPSDDRAKKWSQIPRNTDVLITHTPPHGMLDTTVGGETVGCQPLKARVELLKPRYHVFGHIHESFGECTYKGVTYINAASCNEQYQAVHSPPFFDI